MTTYQIFPSSLAALEVAQQAVAILARWANVQLPSECRVREDSPSVAGAKAILNWPSGASPQPLCLLFDGVHLSESQNKEEDKKHYSPIWAIADTDPAVPYPYESEMPPDAEIKALKAEVGKALEQLEENWDNLSLLTLILEKYGSFVSVGESDVALLDMARSTAAVAAALANEPNLADKPDEAKLSLIAGDLSGIQKFIYTISSDGALKSLRARSFYLELVTEEVVQQVLEEFQLPRSNVIYAGGGNLYVLASGEAEQIEASVRKLREQFNEWLRRSFQGKIFLALDFLQFPLKAVLTKDFATYWSNATKKLATQKQQKFKSQIDQLLKPRASYEPCRVCHRDDLPSLKPLNRTEPDSSPACWTCRSMFELGSQIFKVKAIARSKHPTVKKALSRYYLAGFYYYLFEKPEEALAVEDAETVFLVNNWKISDYSQTKNAVPLLLGNYGKQIEEEPGSFISISAREMTREALGIGRVGYLRMDVDRLGQIFARGLGEKQTLPRLAGLSRQMSYFFKVYLNTLAEQRQQNLPTSAKQLTEEPRLNLLFIYAGGDDLFVSGAWNEVVEFAFDIYQSFRAYTGYNPDITLSGGISIDDIKFPLYQAADSSGDAEDAAKGNGRDSLGLFGKAFKWSEWLGSEQVQVSNLEGIEPETLKYVGEAETLDLFGIFVFVKILTSGSLKLETNYARSFIRNLLLTAEIQDNMIKEIEQRQQKAYSGIINDIRYYLHLPKIAYTLARLPESVRSHRDFAPVRKSLLSPYNAPYFRAIATWIELLNRTKSNAES